MTSESKTESKTIRVAVVGHAGAGKSYFVNRMLVPGRNDIPCPSLGGFRSVTMAPVSFVKKRDFSIRVDLVGGTTTMVAVDQTVRLNLFSFFFVHHVSFFQAEDDLVKDMTFVHGRLKELFEKAQNLDDTWQKKTKAADKVYTTPKRDNKDKDKEHSSKKRKHRNASPPPVQKKSKPQQQRDEVSFSTPEHRVTSVTVTHPLLPLPHGVELVDVPGWNSAPNPYLR